MKLSTNYMGLTLRNPLIVSSSSLTNSVEKIKKIEQAGAGAVVLKSLFEEQIAYESHQLSQSMESEYPEAYDYIKGYTRDHGVADYVSLVRDAKKSVSIPIIASIHCYSAQEWVSLAKELQEAGADALELNINVLNTQKYGESSKVEEKYYQIVQSVTKSVSLPVSVKIGSHFTDLVSFVQKLYASGAKAVVLFNRFFEPDIDIEKMSFKSSEVFSSPADYTTSLRWVAILTGQIKDAQVSASTGVHDGAALIKQLLAGAQTVQVCSALYLHGTGVVTKMLSELNSWMERKEFYELNQFRGTLNYQGIPDPAIYERTQFMRYFASGE